MDTAGLELVEEHIRHILAIMEFPDATVRCQVSEDAMLRVAITVGEAGRLLIGPQGTHLAALQHVLRCLLRRSLTKEVRIIVDVNGYRLQREQELIELAQAMAREAQRTGQIVVLPTMPAPDRRAIHTALADHASVRTESQGEEPHRHVIVRPISL